MHTPQYLLRANTMAGTTSLHSHEFQLELATNCSRRFDHRVELNTVVLRIEQPVQVHTAEANATRHLGFRRSAFVHGLAKLPG